MHSQQLIDQTSSDSSQPAVTVVKPACNKFMPKACINGKRMTNGLELSELVEWCLADKLHVNLQCQLAVKMNDEIADCGLGCSSMVAERRTWSMPSFESFCRLPSQINCLLGIQFQPVRGLPSVDLCNARSNLIDHPNDCCGLVENVDLSVVSIAMDTESMLVGDTWYVSRIDQE